MPGFAAYERANRASGNALGFGIAWIIVGFAVFVAGLGFGLNLHPGITHNVDVVKAPGSAAALIAAWGPGDQAVPGEQLNPNLKGLTCRVYNAKRTIICA